MNLKNISLYTSILILVMGFGLLLQNVTTELYTSDKVILSDSSVTYINSLSASVDSNNFADITNRTSTELQEDNMFLSDETDGSSSITDNLANLNVFRRINQKIINPIKIVYNTPSFLLSLFGLPIDAFSIIANIINIVIYIGLISMILINLK